MSTPTSRHPALPADLARWRKLMRAELIARRQALLPEQREAWTVSIGLFLMRSLPLRPGQTLGFCWPHQGEVDLRPLLPALMARGVRCALPVVEQVAQALVFRAWAPGDEMAQGAMGIPQPVGTPAVNPDLLLIPLVGFGRAGDRLGYGGGYFDRTLAAADPRPLAVGVGFEFAQIDSSFPQAHDIALDAVVTEQCLRWRDPGGLRVVDAQQLRERLADLAEVRGQVARLNAHTVPGVPGLNLGPAR